MRVLRSPDREWRLEVRGDVCTLYRHGGVVVERTSMQRVVDYLLGEGVDPTTFVED